MFDEDESDIGREEIERDMEERRRLCEASSEVYHKALMKSGDTIKYHFSEYPAIRTDEDYLEFIPGEAVLSFSEAKMSYQPMNLPKSLTKLETDTLSDTAIQLYKAILEYAGEVQYPYPNTRARYILSTVKKTPELNEELYLQLMKHLTDSRNNVSEDRTWGLLCLITYNIPVYEEFAPYVLNFLLAYKSSFGLIGNYARLCMKNVEARMAVGPAKVVPDQQDIDNFSLRPPILASIEVVTEEGLVLDIPVLPADKVEDIVNSLVLPRMQVKEKDYYQYGLFYNEISSTSKLPLRKRLARFYKKYNPEKLEQLDYFIETWGDNVEGLFRKLEMRYGPEPLENEEIAEPTLKKQKTMFSKSLTMAKKAAKQIKKKLGFESTYVPRTDTLISKKAHLGDIFLELFKEGKSPTFKVKRKLFKNEELEFDDTILRQCRYDFFNNNLIIESLEDAMKAVTIEVILKNELAIITTAEELKKVGAKDLIPIQFLTEHQPEELYEMILSEMLRFKNIEVIEKNLNFSFFEICQKQLTHNMGLFTSSEKNGRKKLTLLGVNKDGLNILNKQRTEVVNLYKFVNIKEYAVEDNVFTMKIATKDEVEGRLLESVVTYTMKDATALYELIYDYTFNFKKLGLVSN